MTKKEVNNNTNDLVDQKYKWYLYDLGPIIQDYVDDLRRENQSCKKGTKEKAFVDGQLMSFNWLVEMLKQQADAFSIGREELRLD